MRAGEERPAQLDTLLDSRLATDDTRIVLFMVIETFNGNLDAVGERFSRQGRMLPDGVSYEASWLDTAGDRCWQVMEAPDRATLDVWIARWSDLVEFEVVPALTSKEFWAQRQTR
jgi:hypothetical protein